MAQIYNTELFEELKDVVKLQQLRDVLPSQLADKVVPVIDINPKHARTVQVHKMNESASQGAITIFTTPTDRDFYITNIELSLAKDATSDMTSGSTFIQAQVSSEAVRLLSFQTIALTAQNIVLAIAYPFPVKVEQGSAIIIPATGATVGVTRRCGMVHGFFVDNSRA